jgi:hypothetical protein
MGKRISKKSRQNYQDTLEGFWPHFFLKCFFQKKNCARCDVTFVTGACRCSQMGHKLRWGRAIRRRDGDEA